MKGIESGVKQRHFTMTGNQAPPIKELPNNLKQHATKGYNVWDSPWD